VTNIYGKHRFSTRAKDVLLAGQDSLSRLNNSVAPLPDDALTSLHYHISDTEKQRMFLLDPTTGHSHVTSSAGTSWAFDFLSGVYHFEAFSNINQTPIDLQTC
jgi:hypothetical protein